MLLGIHVLACNEEDVLGRCLGSVQGLADEIVVTDTGSMDGTIDIANAFGARVVRAAWEDDFAAARNAGLDAARTVWVLVLDADEWLDAGVDRASLRRLLREAQSDSLSLVIENRYGHGASDLLSHDAVRLFRADCGFRYTGVIHEQLVRPGIQPYAVDGPPSGLRLRHDGYLPEKMARKAKAARNLRLIGKALRLEPDHPFHLYNQGVAFCQLNKPKDAAAAFALACLFAPADAPYREMLIRDRAKTLLALGDADGASALLHREVDRYADYPDVQLAYGDSLMAQRRAADARSAYEAALRAGDASRGAVREAGAGTYRARCGLAAAEAALGRGEHALRLYAAAAKEAPRYGPALAGWAEQLQAAGEGDEAIHEALASSLGKSEAASGDGEAARGAAAPGDSALLARVLGGIGAHAAALVLWREAGPLAPDDARAYAASLAGAGHAGAARALLLAALGRRGRSAFGAASGLAAAARSETTGPEFGEIAERAAPRTLHGPESGEIAERAAPRALHVPESGETAERPAPRTLHVPESDESSERAAPRTLHVPESGEIAERAAPRASHDPDSGKTAERAAPRASHGPTTQASSAAYASSAALEVNALSDTKKLNASPEESASAPTLDPAQAAGLCLDAALYSWEAGVPLGGELREAISAASEELSVLFAAVERYAAPYLAVRPIRTSGVDSSLPGWVSFVGMLVERALELGLLALAVRLRQAAPALEEQFALSLYRHGYAQAAAARLLQAMEQRPLLAEESFAFGELLLLKGLYSEALAMFEAAIDSEDEAMQARARLGAAFCSLTLAREALLPWVEHASAAYGGGWPLADIEQLQLAMLQTEAMGWRTPWTAAQRRRMNVGEAAEADYALHDR
ncbi:glycosyltransferase family 2 protein [Paenibacillus rhizovicinus]|uniref:Glycosyltransferase family 2 protein n=1 Tax=Paenibacillus rhizovicinus TaxID=2704463 RepID=A0A6C0P3P1_9BACL|nr:glycosyltransferase [Paenibacillus rhizovicinus]QHW32453.1 glycosyltransferase family 2 protein [Paenibacillus rhizovicinus]